MQFTSDQLFRNRVVYHLVFWALFIGTITFVQTWQPEYTFWQSLRMQLSAALGYALVIYVNLLVLIPRFLIERRRVGRYLTSLLFTLLAGLPINMLINYVNIPDKQRFWMEHTEFRFALIVFVNMTIMVLITMALKFAKDWFNQQQRTRELMRQNLQSELKFLKSQVNPHFLFNTLNSLYSLTLKKDDRAPEIVLKLSDMMRYMLYESQDRRVPLDKEIAYIENYIALESIRQGSTDPVTFELKGNVSGQQISPLLFIPFLENSFKHGMNNQIGSGWVAIELEVEGKELEFTVTNSKPTVEKEDGYVGGIGLQNARRRLDLIYPNRHELNISDETDTFSVHLKIQLD